MPHDLPQFLYLLSLDIVYFVPHCTDLAHIPGISFTFAWGNDGYLSVYIRITANLASVNLGATEQFGNKCLQMSRQLRALGLFCALCADADM